MDWFEEQVKTRKELDAKAFEDSFLSLAGIRRDNQSDLSDESVRENYAINQILSYFRHSMVEIPKNIEKFNDKLNYSLRQSDIECHKIELNGDYVSDGSSPILIFTILNNFPVVLFPQGIERYYYINYKTGKRVYVKASIINKLELEAYSFYRPLPSKKVSIKEYAKFIYQSIRPLDAILLVLFSIFAAAIGLLLPYLTKTLTGGVTESKDLNQFIFISLYVVAAATGLLLVNAVKGFFNMRISITIEKSVTAATMKRILLLPTSFFKKYNTGELSARFKSVPHLAYLIITGVFMTLLSVIMSFAYLFQLTSFAPSLILPVVLILFISSIFSVITALIQKEHQRKQLKLASKESGVTYEMINGIQKIRLAGSEKRAFAKWASAYSKSARVRYNPPLILRLSTAISLLITFLGNIAIYYIAIKNDVDVSSYMAFVASYGILSASFASLAQMIGVIFNIQPVYEMAKPILESEPESSSGKKIVESINGNIKLENVSFRYNESSPLILDNFSLDIKEGEYVAIVGQTGCGKSTLVRLLLGFEKPDQGKVLFDDINIDDVELSSLRKNIGSVLQNSILFHADILSNILISSPDLQEKDAWRAAEIANIASDIKEMPMGMNTVISEGQGGISGGQKQRIMIARAIVHQPKVLIFDEATSALDNKTQNSISQSIGKLNCTRIVIAHRLSTIMNADRIIMLENGRIIEEGNYQELIEKKGKFAELVERQRLIY